MAHLYVCDRCDKQEKQLSLVQVIFRQDNFYGGKMLDLCEGCADELQSLLKEWAPLAFEVPLAEDLTMVNLGDRGDLKD